MIQLPSLSARVAVSAPLAGTVSKKFANCPSLHDYCQQWVLTQWRLHHPQHVVNVDKLCLATPLSTTNSKPADFAGYRMVPLTEVLVERYLDGRNLALIPNWQFLTEQAGAENPQALAVDMLDIQKLINEAAPTLLDGYAQSLVQFWNEVAEGGMARWQWLADYLKQHLKLDVSRAEKAGQITATEAATAMAVVLFAQGSERAAQPPGHRVQAGLVMFGTAQDRQVSHALLIERALPAPAPAVQLVYSPGDGLQSFASIKAAQVWLLQQAGLQGSGAHCLQYVPDTDVFDAQAQALLEETLQSIDAIGRLCQRHRLGLEALHARLEQATTLWDIDNQEDQAKRAVLRAAMPGWLASATHPVRRRYARHLVELAMLQMDDKGQGFLDGIPDITAFATSTLLERIGTLHPGHPLTSLDDVQVHVLTTPNALLSIVNAGDFTLEDTIIGLPQLALYNLSGRPSGRLLVEPRAGATLPQWVSTHAIEQLVTACDVGRRYLELLTSRLRTEPEAKSRRTLYIRQVRAQWPMLAQEYWLRGVADLDETGYRMVECFCREGSGAMLDGHALKLGNLAFKVTAEATPDPATAIYVLGTGPSGTVLLYRPLNAEPLRQFSSAQLLLEAVRDEAALQRDVLDWLSPAAQMRYGNGGFAEPHVTRFGAGSDFAPVSVPPPALLAIQPLAGDVWTALYEQTVDALLTTADRQSISNAQNRWISFERLAWTLFNALLPLVSGPLATAGWLLQLLKQVEGEVQASTAGDVQAQSQAQIDLLFNLALSLLTLTVETAVQTHDLPRLVGVDDLRPVKTELGVETAVSNPVTRPSPADSGPGIDVASLSPTVKLDFHWVRPSSGLSAQQRTKLATFELARPAGLGPAVPHGPLQGLYNKHEQWFAEVDGRFYAVAPQADAAQIVDALDPAHRGPWLRRDEAQRWVLDLRLRLVGGSPNTSIERQRTARKEQLAPLREQFQALVKTQQSEGRELDVILKTVEAAKTQGSDKLVQLRERYLALAEPHLETLSNGLELIDRIAELDPAGQPLKIKAEMLRILASIGRNVVIYLRDDIGGLDSEHAYFKDVLAAGDLSDADDARFFVYLLKSLNLLEREHRWIVRCNAWMKQLEQIPYYSVKPLAELSGQWLGEQPAQAWAALLVDGLGTVTARRMLDDIPDLDLNETLLTPARLIVDSQVQLSRLDNVPRLERIDVLASALEEYERLQDAYRYYLAGWPALAKIAELEQMMKLLDGFKVEAEDMLAPLFREQYNAGRAARKKKRHRNIINTRQRGLLVGKVRKRPGASGGHAVDIHDPINHAVVQSYVLDEAAGDWVPEVQPPRPAPTRPKIASTLNQVVKHGQDLLDGADAKVLNAWKQARTAQRPSELQDILVHHGERLLEAAERVEQVLTRSNEIDLPTSRRESALAKAEAMRVRGRGMIEEGRLLRIQTLKRQPPTAERVNYLKQQGEVTIHREGARKAMGKGNQKDFLQEYSVRNTAGEVLWYAHFHYPKLGTAAAAYSRAHLKLSSQRLHGYRKQLDDFMAGREVIAILRRQIEPPLDALFLDAE